jgi:putative ABC transport system permease protein
MFQNYIKIAIRNILKYKLHAVINIFGLAIAIACCLLLFLFIRNELSYDSFHKNKDTIFRINYSFVRENTSLIQATTQAPLAPTLKKELPDIINATRFLNANYTVKIQDNLFTERITFTDPDFLKMFSFNLTQGNPDDVLRDRNTIVISEEVANKYFRNANPIGNQITIIRYGVAYSFTINGVIESPPENSSIQYDILIPFQKLRGFFGDDYFSNWDLYSVKTYVQLLNSSQVELVTSKLPVLFKKYSEEVGNKFSLQPLADIHFAATVQETMVPASSITYSYILAGISLLILMIASFNSMNISSALVSMRYKEVGVRKVLGAARKQIIIQVCVETTILASIAFIIGILLAELFLPTFNILAEKTLDLKYFKQFYSLIWSILFIIGIGLLSGLFPSILLSKYPPAELYQRKMMIGGRSFFSRSSIMIQFGLSIFLIVCTLIMSSQLKYIENYNLGFNQNQIVVLPYRSINSQQTLDQYRSELIKYRSILNVSGAYSYPAGSYHNAKATSGNATFSINHCKVDYDFLETFGISLIEGRNFSRDIASDTTAAIIINEAVVNRMGWNSPIGKKMIIEWMGWEVEVVGVVKDFHYASLHEKIEPLVFYLDPFVPLEYFFVKIKSEEIPQTIELLRNKWTQIVPDQPFEYFFLDQRFAQFYQSEERWNRIVTYSSIIAIFIACFGLFGLSALIMTKRTKEIGVRKVVGASVQGIVLMLSSEFTKWIFLANIIAWPAAYYVMNLWLQNFAYKIEISWSTFVLAGCIGLIIALAVISFQAIKTAWANPIESLRYE